MSSFDQVIKNILSDIFGSDEQEEVTRPKARPSGLGAPTTSLRPKARPDEEEDIKIPSSNEEVSNFVKTMADFDDTPEEGVEIPLASLQANARDLEGRFKTSGMQLAKLNRALKGTDGGRAKVKSVEEDTSLDDLMAEIKQTMDPLASIRPRARPKSLAEIQAIEKEQRRAYTEVDSTKDLQVALNAAGITVNGKPLVEDGIMGNNTKKAIKTFQKDKGLKVDGIAGPKTKQALRSLAPKPEITEEVLPESEGLMSKRTFKLEDVKEASILGGLGNLLGNLGLGTSEFRFFAGNLTNPGSTRTENSLNKSDIKALRSAVNTSMQDNRSYTTYEDFGFDEMEVNKYSALSGIVDPDLRMARSVGVFNFDVDNKGNVFIKDTFDFNPGPKRIAYYEAVKKGNKKDALAMLADASPVQAASMVGYAKQESLKEKNKPYQTQININLGNPKTWN